jgi:hypothetical protein
MNRNELSGYIGVSNVLVTGTNGFIGVKDKRSLHIGIIEGELFFTDESRLHFIEFVNVKETVKVYKYSYHYQDRNSDLIFRYDMAPHHRVGIAT